MKKEIVTVTGAPPLPFSPAVKAGGFIFVSGQLGIVDAAGKPLAGIEAQTGQCLENMKRVLEAAGASLDDVVKVTVFLRREEDFAAMNRVYQSYFAVDKPARSTVIAGLVMPEMLIEIDCIAASPGV
jgi:2-iminobutanoate/2-iminopropanoate deaminase